MANAEHGHHITPLRTLTGVFVGLVILTIVTVVSSRVSLGALAVPVALVIAIGKASLVVVFFMALKWDNRVNGVVLALGVLFVSIFLIFTLFDTAFRGDLSNVDSTTISDTERAGASGAVSTEASKATEH
jgi:cytochrome c oxidase subunit 4